MSYKITHRRARAAAARRKETGIGLLETLLLVFVLGGALVSGALWLRSQADKQLAEQQIDVLQRADQQLRGYAASYSRLPCPAYDDTDGKESCGRGPKGLLPWRTLGIDAANARGNLAKLGYLVHNKPDKMGSDGKPIKATSNLTYLVHRFNTKDWDGDKVELDDKTINSLDFCAALLLAAKDTDATFGQLSDGTTQRNMAYALAHPGARDADGDGNPFDGRNGISSTEMELPERAQAGSSYDDRVFARDFASLAQGANCPQLMASIDDMTLSVNVIDEVRVQKGWATATATVLTAVNGVKTAVQAAKTIASAMVLADAISKVGTAVGQVSAAAVGCVVGCPDLPRAISALVASLVGVVASSAAIAANGVAVYSHIAATAMTATVMIQAGLSIEDSNIHIDDAADKACQAMKDSEKEKNEAATELTKANNAKTTAASKQGEAWGAMLGYAHSLVDQINNAASPKTTHPLTWKDYVFDELNASWEAWSAALSAKAKAEADLKKAEDLADKAASTGNSKYNEDLKESLQEQIDAEEKKTPKDEDKIAALKDALANVNAQIDAKNSSDKQIADLKAQIGDLQTQISKEKDPDRKAELEAQLSSLQSQLGELDAGVAGKRAIRDAAVKNLDAKKAALNQKKEDVIWTFQLWYCIAIPEEKDKDGKIITPASPGCTHYIDGRYYMRQKVNAYIDRLDASKKANEDQGGAQIAYNKANSTYTQSKASCEQLTQQLLDNFNLWTPPKSYIPKDWAGAGDIMRAADAKGGVQ